jgi:hypothetical protein
MKSSEALSLQQMKNGRMRFFSLSSQALNKSSQQGPLFLGEVSPK